MAEPNLDTEQEILSARCDRCYLRYGIVRSQVGDEYECWGCGRGVLIELSVLVDALRNGKGEPWRR